MKAYKFLLSLLIAFSFNVVNSINTVGSLNYIDDVDCQEYALDQMDNFEAHFGCIEDAGTYNLIAAELIRLCQAMDQ